MSTTLSTAAPAEVRIRQYRPVQIAAVWLAAAAPMGLGAWLLAPAWAGGHTGTRFGEALLYVLTAGLVWQCVLTVALAAVEQRTVRPAVLRKALWLQVPSTPDGRRGGRLWWWVPVTVLAFGAVQFAPIDPPPVAGRDFGELLGSDAGQGLLHGNWGLFAVIVVAQVFNTVLGEELLFRGLLLPRMRGVCGRFDFLVNGAIFGLYHLHQPWSMPEAALVGMIAAYATSRLRSSWLGIIAHSAQSVFLIVLTLAVVAG